MRIFFKLLYVLISLIETLIIFRIVMSIIGANESHSFVSWVFATSDIFISPFEGIVAKELYLDKFRIELTPIVSLIFFSIVGFIISELAKTLKKTD